MPEPAAPRLRAYLGRVEGRPVFTVTRSVWEAMKPRLGESQLVEVLELPISRVARDATVLAVNAEWLTSTGVDIVVYRNDPTDTPKRINVDRYAVIEDLPSHVDLPRIINAASTEDNPNLREYLRSNVFLVRKDPGPDHHLVELPAHVVLRSSATNDRR